MLRSIPMNGTFNQLRPLDQLRGVSGPVYSIYFQAATDRWPLLSLFELVQALFDRSYASAALESALGIVYRRKESPYLKALT